MKCLLAPLFLYFLFYGNLQAAEDRLPAASFAFPSVQQGGSARAIGMGSTYVGVAEGSASILWNPAGLSNLTDAEIAIHHNAALLDAIQEIAVLGLPLGYGHGLGATLSYEDNGVFDGRDSQGNATGNYSARAFGASLGWGFKGPADLSMGLTVKGNRQDLAGEAQNAFAGDMGILWSHKPWLNIGAAYTNLGPDVNGHPLAQGARAGISSYLGKCENFQSLFAISGEALTRGENSLHLGFEQSLYQVLALRAGYGLNLAKPESNGLLGWTFGGGIALKQLRLDYAYVPLNELGNMQRVSLTYSFGEGCSSAKPMKPAASKPVALLTKPVRTATHTPVPRATPTPRVAAAAPIQIWQSYVVKKNDSLWVISGKTGMRGDSFQWPLLFKDNRDQISDPDHIEPNQDLKYKKEYSENEVSSAVNKAQETERFEPHTTSPVALPVKY
jgi:hypothetical protein